MLFILLPQAIMPNPVINSKLCLIDDKPAPNSWFTFPPPAEEDNFSSITSDTSDTFVDQVVGVKKTQGLEEDSLDEFLTTFFIFLLF